MSCAGPAVLGFEPFLGWRLGVLGQPLDLVLAKLQLDAAFDDLVDLFGRDVLAAGEQAMSDREAVEDVALGVSDRLLDLADVFALRVDDLPAALDHDPGDRIWH